ncbi:MAG: Ig-like domain-containing protein [Actinomycetota bacterium]
MTIRSARTLAAGSTALALVATLSVAMAAPAMAADTTVAVDDTATVDANHAVTIDVLANDVAPEGTFVQLLNASGTPTSRVTDLYGTWVTDGQVVTHTPPDGRAGPRTLRYRITDPDGDTAVATIRVQVNSINTPLAFQDSGSLALGESRTFDVLANDFGGSSRTTGERFPLLPETLRVVDAAGAPQTTVSNESGTFSVVDGRIAYVPAEGYWGSTSIRYVVQDSVRQSTRPTSLNVVVAPTPDAVDDAATTTIGQPVTIDVLANDVTPAGTTFDTWGFTVTPGVRVLSVAQPGVGTWTRDAEGRAVFTPDAAFTGTATVDYMLINSRYSSDVATIAVQVAAPAPTLTADAAQTPYFTATTVDVLANDTAPEGAALDPASLRLVDADGALVTELESQRGTWSVVDGVIVFAPTQGAYGTDRVTYSVATTAGGTATSTVTVTTATPRVLSRGEIVAHTFSAGSPDVTVDVLANDETEGNSSIDASTLAIADHNGQPVQQRTTADGTWSVVDGQVRFTPADGFEGRTSTYYIVQNDAGFTGRAVVTIDATWAVVEVSVAAQDDAVEIPRKGGVTVDVLANDTAIGGALDASSLQLIGADGEPTDALTDRAGTWTVVGGQIHFQAHARQKGEASIDYVVASGDASDTATLTVDVRQHHHGNAVSAP